MSKPTLKQKRNRSVVISEHMNAGIRKHYTVRFSKDGKTAYVDEKRNIDIEYLGIPEVIEIITKTSEDLENPILNIESDVLYGDPRLHIYINGKREATDREYRLAEEVLANDLRKEEDLKDEKLARAENLLRKEKPELFQ